MLQSSRLPKLTIALALSLSFAAPAAAEMRASLSDRIDRLEKGAAAADLQVAQLSNRPPGDVPGGGGFGGPGQDAAGLDVRVDRLENQIRTLNGQIEQIEFEIHRLDDQLRKFQQDVDFRFQDSGRGGPPAASPPPRAGQKRSEADEPTLPTAALPDAQSTGFGVPGRGTRSADAFDPSVAPDAPGTPRTLGVLQADRSAPADVGTPRIMATPDMPASLPLPQGPLGLEARDPNAPLQLSSAPRTAPPPVYTAVSPRGNTPSAPPIQPQPSNGAGNPAAVTRASSGTQVAALPTSTPRDDFETAAAALKGEQFETAEIGFKSFIQKHPKDRLLPDAVFDLGETYFQRNRYRDAAEQYLKISTDYAKTAKAPDSLLRLGQSLDKLGAKEQACAAFAEVGRKYPNAAANLRATADRESKRVQC